MRETEKKEYLFDYKPLQKDMERINNKVRRERDAPQSAGHESANLLRAVSSDPKQHFALLELHQEKLKRADFERRRKQSIERKLQTLDRNEQHARGEVHSSMEDMDEYAVPNVPSDSKTPKVSAEEISSSGKTPMKRSPMTGLHGSSSLSSLDGVKLKVRREQVHIFRRHVSLKRRVVQTCSQLL